MNESEMMRSSPFTTLHFRQPFWRYQQMILDVVEQQVNKDTKYHLVAPPGSGKTIVGLELVRRFGRPAVVLCPTTTIQQQWREKATLFTEEPGWVAEHTSMDPTHLADINFFTYQVLSTPGENVEFAERAAVERWVDDLLSSGQAGTEEEARGRIATLRESNPAAFRREVSRRYLRVKREFLRESAGRTGAGETAAGATPPLDARRFLHQNARDLIDRIVALGAGTLVLDECHHLLDYWAFILRELIRELPGVRVIGLTATLPDPENDSEFENYDALLGPVDFEVPTPAVVKEGNLAPYRDMVYFCGPSPRENEYLNKIQDHFTAAIARVTESQSFATWLDRTLLARPQEGKEEPEPFEQFFNREPLLAIAGVKVLVARGVELPADIPVIEEMQGEPTVDDWLTLLEAFSLRALKVSADPDEQALYRELRGALLSFGITISETGIRHGRSPGDMVLALSESKDAATAAILAAEARVMGERLRAVVLTDYEKISAQTRRLKDVLDPDAGSAVRIFRRLIAAPATNALDPILVTGKIILVDADSREKLEEGIRGWMEQHGASFSWQWQATDDERILQLTGSGGEWSSRTYVALVTSLFEKGLTRCLVGTRGLFGEGWDALSLNTLVDLSAVTTRTGVQQLRGRSLRLDPAWPRKVAHNWDVVCVSRKFDKGNADLARFVARHRHTWGVVVQPRAKDLVEAVGQAMKDIVPSTPMEGRIVRGLAHLDMQLATDLALRDFKRIEYDKYTTRMLNAVRERDRVYDLWQVGQPYSNFTYSATRLEAEDLKFRTAYTVETSLRMMAWRLLVSLLAVAATVWINGAMLIPWSEDMPTPLVPLCLGGLTVLAALATLVWNARAIWKVFHRAFLELPADAILLDMGRALLAALRDAGVVSRNLSDNYVRVVETAAGGYEVMLDYASPEDSDTFARSYREMMGPLGDPRYLIERDSRSLRNLIYRPLWLLVRTVLGQNKELRAYHRVPDVLASRKERAEALARYWQRYVGGGRLVYTRTAEGRKVLLEARGKPRRRIRQMAFEVWK